MNFIIRFFATLRYREAMRKATKAARETGRRHYVIPVTDGLGKLLVVDRKNFRLLKQKRYLSHIHKIADLERECFYHTPYSSGEGALSGKEIVDRSARYLDFCEALRLKKRPRRRRKCD